MNFCFVTLIQNCFDGLGSLNVAYVHNCLVRLFPQVKSGAVSSTACHCCHVSSELRCPVAQPRRCPPATRLLVLLGKYLYQYLSKIWFVVKEYFSLKIAVDSTFLLVHLRRFRPRVTKVNSFADSNSHK